MTFTQSARRLAGEAALALGWRPDEFWRATPAELAAIRDAARPADAGPPDLAALMEMFPDG